jgi:hypothetical protein
MTASEFETLRQDIKAMRADVDRYFVEIEIRFAQVDAKLDAKPSVAALYQAVAVMMFGLSAAITGTVVVLKNIGLLG